MRVRLKQRDEKIDVGIHLFGNLKPVFGIGGFGCFHPLFLNDARTVFDTYQRASRRAFGNHNRCRFAHFVGLLIGGERQHRQSARVGFVGTPVHRCPIHVENGSGGVPASGIFHQNQVTPPIGIIDLKTHFSVSALRRNYAVGNGRNRRVVHVRTQIFLRTVPPPTPVEFINLILYIAARNFLSVRIQGNYIENDGLVGFQKSRRFNRRRFHSGIHAVRRIIGGLRVETHIASGFKNA